MYSGTCLATAHYSDLVFPFGSNVTTTHSKFVPLAWFVHSYPNLVSSESPKLP